MSVAALAVATLDTLLTGDNAVSLLRATTEELEVAKSRIALLEAEGVRLRTTADESPAPDLAIEAARVLTMYPAHGTLSTLADACERAARHESDKPCAKEAWEDAAEMMRRAANAVHGAEIESGEFKLGDALELLARGPR